MQRIGHIKVLGVAMIMLASCLVSSCIKATELAPNIKGEILSFEIEGQLGSTVNSISRTVEVSLSEAVDICNATVSKIELVTTGRCDIAEGSTLDLTEPYNTTITTVAGYDWTIVARQNIEYRFEIEGQVGDPIFERHTRRAFAYVAKGTDMSRVKIVDLKLSPADVPVALSPAIESGDEVNFTTYESELTHLREVKVTYSYPDREVVEQWELYITEIETQIDIVDPFARRVYLSAYGQQGLAKEESRFEYRLAPTSDPDIPDTQEWTRVPDEMTSGMERGLFKATLTGLEPETQYEVRAISGDSESDIERFTTLGTRALEGAGFEEWHLPGGGSNTWNPWRQDALWEVDRWWDTGNEGAALSGGSNSTATEPGEGCPANPGGRAARLESIRVMQNKPAGGNIYYGKFAGVSGGTNGRCDLGHTWTHKPTKLKFWYKYFPQPINEISEAHTAFHPSGKSTRPEWDGTPDTLHVCVALWADPAGRDIPFTVNTDPAAFVDFTIDQPGVMAYGYYTSTVEQAEWKEQTIEIDYFKTGEMPANTQLYLLITSSKNCNYFIAGARQKGTDGSIIKPGSLMYVDELELVYD